MILVPSFAAAREMMKLGLTIEDCRIILEEGCDAPRKRGEDTIERWLNRGNKTYNAVVVKVFNSFYNDDILLITHIGRFTRRK